jgi:SAM-dependent methyltransferase
MDQPFVAKLSNGESFTFHKKRKVQAAADDTKICGDLTPMMVAIIIVIFIILSPLLVLWIIFWRIFWFTIWLVTEIFELILMSIPPIRDYRLSKKTGSGTLDDRAILLRDVSGNVLDVGSGGGVYLKHCMQADHVVAVEPNTLMHAEIFKAGRGLKKLTVVRDLRDVASDPSAASSFDWVIFGNVLCCVPDVANTLALVDTFLKPNGRIFYYEHIGYCRGSWNRFLQDLVNPVRRVRTGCNCNLDTLEELEKLPGYELLVVPLDRIEPEVEPPSLLASAFRGPIVMGLALKHGTKLTPVESA